MVKPSLKLSLLAATLCLSFSNPSFATMAVLDSAAVAKAVEQLNALKEQLDVVNDMKDKIDEQIKTIGEYGKITLPLFNIAKIGNQLKKDMQCLKPNFKDLMPELKFEDQMFSICDSSRFYRDNLWVDPIKINGEPVFDTEGREIPRSQSSWGDLDTARETVRQRRQNIVQKSVSDGLGQADIANDTTEKTGAAIDDLQASVDGAKTEQDRLAVIAQGHVINARIGNQTNQLLAQLLKVTSAYVMEATVPIERYSPETGETN